MKHPERLSPMAEDTLPWQPLFTVERSGLPELTIHGILYGWADERSLMSNAGKAMMRIGDTRASIWPRSVLKPWQLMVIYPALKEAYPQLSDRHFALMTASHNSDPEQLALLKELQTLGGFSDADLQCPACQPMNAANLQPHGTPLCNPCAGKHLGYLLYFKARGLNTAQYMNPQAEPYQLLTALLGYLLNKEPEEFPITIDGCGMPNYAMSPVEIAQLYHALIMPLPRDFLRQCPEETEPAFEHWDAIAPLIRNHPELVGGQGRLDTRLMQELPVIAKEGADGLLALAIGKSEPFPDGAGFLVKLASGYEPKHLETVIRHVLAHYGLGAEPVQENGCLSTRFHFDLNPAQV